MPVEDDALVHVGSSDFGEDFGGDVLAPAKVALDGALIDAERGCSLIRIRRQLVAVSGAATLGRIANLAHPNEDRLAPNVVIRALGVRQLGPREVLVDLPESGG